MRAPVQPFGHGLQIVDRQHGDNIKNAMHQHIGRQAVKDPHVLAHFIEGGNSKKEQKDHKADDFFPKNQQRIHVFPPAKILEIIIQENSLACNPF